MKVVLRSHIDLDASNLQGWLLHGKAYTVLNIEQYFPNQIGLRIASEQSGTPVLFRVSLFDIVDKTLPNTWRVLALDDNSVWLGPEAFGRDGFWEDYFDQKPQALDEFRVAKEQIIADS